MPSTSGMISTNAPKSVGAHDLAGVDMTDLGSLGERFDLFTGGGFVWCHGGGNRNACRHR